MITSRRWNISLAALLTAALLGACGGGGDSNGGAGAATANPLAQEANAPAATGAVGLDGLNWINFRRAQAGLPQLLRNGLIDNAALNHSNYLRINNFPDLTHSEIPGQPGFTGIDVLDRLNAAGYRFAPASSASYIYGEVIAASGNSTGASLAEQLMAAIYHRFLMLEPMFKEIGAGAAANGSGYTYFTADFAANNGYGPGLGRGKLASYPFDGQSNVPVNFFSDQEVPDPVPNQNEVGYPVSVHGDLAGSVRVQAFTLRPRGGADLAVRLLSAPGDQETPPSAAAIVPLAVLAPNTVYDVTFSGTVDGVGVARNWSFTTR